MRKKTAMFHALGATTAAALFALFAMDTASADSLKVLHNFSGKDGLAPTGMIEASDGNFYGATTSGGDQSGCLPPDGCGTLFRMDMSGQLQRLHVFHKTDGYYPSGLVEGPDGKLYGVTREGGQKGGGGGGVLFSLSPTGADFKIDHRFVGGDTCCDGARPQPGMVLAGDGKFYGTTELGGDYRDNDHPGFGTVFRFDPATGKIKFIHSFQLADGNGIFPNGYVIQAKDGFIYGTTREGGSAGGGTLWKIKTDGTGFAVVTQLPNLETHSGPIQGADGNFYGTDDIGNGSVYKVDQSGNLTFVNRFDSSDGKGLFFPVTQLSDGFLYGTTEEGGLRDPQGGDVFRLSTGGKIRILHSFDSNADSERGYIPNAKLILGTDGKLYGTTALGGKKRLGTIFRIDADDLGAVKTVSAPARIKSGHSAQGRVTLFKPAPAGGVVVNLNAGFGAASVPATVTVAEGQTSAKFRIDTMQIGAEATIRLYGSVNGQGLRTQFVVTP
ncbi:MAG: hypothetical protein JO208_00510 [Alphaproteobacteria bacterium]|nr:hypothetical protein [Alphaproteobacteria bacterium]